MNRDAVFFSEGPLLEGLLYTHHSSSIQLMKLYFGGDEICSEFSVSSSARTTTTGVGII